MSVYAVLDPFVPPAYALLTHVAALVRPLAAGADAAVALILVTLLVRLALVPFTVRMVRAERARRALAPETARLRERFAGDRQRLTEELRAAHQRAGVSPLAGLGPALVQVPVMLVVYRLARLPMIGGVHNLVATAGLFGAPLTSSLAGLTVAGTALPVVAGVLAVVLAVATVSSRRQGAQAVAGGSELVWPARLLPYGLVVSAAVVPLALTLVLVTSSAWMIAERAVLRA
jgi:YidC/Oxa1 family membrane protein insertase